MAKENFLTLVSPSSYFAGSVIAVGSAIAVASKRDEMNIFDLKNSVINGGICIGGSFGGTLGAVKGFDIAESGGLNRCAGVLIGGAVGTIGGGIAGKAVGIITHYVSVSVRTIFDCIPGGEYTVVGGMAGAAAAYGLYKNSDIILDKANSIRTKLFGDSDEVVIVID